MEGDVMTQPELYAHLEDIGLPIAYKNFDEDNFDDIPDPPFLVYLFTYSDDLMADNINYVEISNFQIELYTDKKDLASEKKVQDKLKEIEIPYFKQEFWIENERLHQVIYDIKLF